MFLTQTEVETRARNSMHRSKSLVRKKFQKLSSMNSDHQGAISKKSSSTRTFNMADLNKELSPFVPETKWNKIVDLFNMPQPAGEEGQKEEVKSIRPGLAFYRLLANQQLMKKYKLRLNFPQTYIEISGQLVEIRTDESNCVSARKVKIQNYSSLMLTGLQKQIKKIQQAPIKYKKHYDYRENPFAPVVVTKASEDADGKFEVNVENIKNFGERRSRPSNNKIVQRFVYSRGMRAMIMRIGYSRKKLGQQRQQFCGFRFQNIDNIFKTNKKNNEIYETFKAQSTISATYERQDKIEYSKITNIKGLQKFIQPSKELIKFLQSSQKIRVNQLYVDYLVDLFDRPWLINIKKINYESLNTGERENSRERVRDHKYSLHIAGSYGICRLCSIEYLKKNLRKSISNKMLCEFLSHLRQRMKVSEYENLQFVKQIIRKNIKNYITLQVCESCYRTVAEEYKLIESEQKLAKICNIDSQIQAAQHHPKPLHLPSTLKQWRLMLYFVGISNIPQELFRDQEEILLRYRLGNGEAVENSWKVKVGHNKTSSSNFYGSYNVDLALNNIKIHYFYSETLDISEFLKETEISLQLATAQDQKIFAKGSSGTLSCFGNQFYPNLCLRQTSTLLLFYNNGEYCELAFKIGVICDGVYQVSDSISLHPLNKVYFADNHFTNSNPIPREWMEAFGAYEQKKKEQKDPKDPNDPKEEYRLGLWKETETNEISYEQIMKPQIDDRLIDFVDLKSKNKGRKNLPRKSLHMYR